MRAVVDASVVLAFLLDEPGGEILANGGCSYCLCSVNLAEVLTRVIDRGLSVDDAMTVLKHLGIEHYDQDREDAIGAARLRGETREFGLSLGDRSCLALARRLGVAVLTADTAWSRVDLGLDIRLIR